MIHPRDIVRNRAAVDVGLEPTPSTVPTLRPSTEGEHAGARGEDRHQTPVVALDDVTARSGDRGRFFYGGYGRYLAALSRLPQPAGGDR